MELLWLEILLIPLTFATFAFTVTSCSAETWFNDARDVTDEGARSMCSNPMLSLTGVTFVALSIRRLPFHILNWF